MLAPPPRLAQIIRAWVVLLPVVSKSCAFAGVGSAVEVGFDYRDMVCIKRDF